MCVYWDGLTVRWTQIGNYIISGGHESVMVQWQLDTGRKQFLPHLSSPIRNIIVSPSGSSYVIKLADNSVVLLSARGLREYTTLAGLQAHPKQNSSSVAAVLHPKQPDHLLIAVPVSQDTCVGAYKAASAPFLQTYDIRADCHVSRQALTRTNITTLSISPEGGEITTPDILHMAISKCGEWLATVDVWRPLLSIDPNEIATCGSEADALQEINLKFWRWNGLSGLWELVNRIDSPHFSRKGPEVVLDLAAQSHGPGFATIGRDAVLRLWFPITRHHQLLGTWKCGKSIDLGACVGKSDVASALEAACLSFSGDGSVLAVCLRSSPLSIVPTQATTVLVDVQAGRICCSRAGLFSGAPHAVRFVSQWLIIAAERSLSVWDTVDGSVRAVGSSQDEVNISMEEGSPKLLAASPSASAFAVSNAVSNDRRMIHYHVQVYGLDSLALLYDIPLKSAPIALLSDSFSGNFVVVDAAANVRRIGRDGKSSKAMNAQSRDLSIQVSSGLASLMGDRTFYMDPASALPTKAETGDTVSPRKQMGHVFDGVPSFSLPPADVLFKDIVKSLR